MYSTLDYESIETHLGDRLRQADNLDIHADHFFPVSLLDKLFHFSEKSRGSLTDPQGRCIHHNFHGHDFDRWIDNLVAATRICLLDSDGNRESVALVDIDSMTFGNNDATVTVTLPDETSYTLMDRDFISPITAKRLEDLDIILDLKEMFGRPPVDNDSDPYMGFGAIAHIVRVVCEKSGVEPSRVDPHALSSRLFDHFGNEMLPLIPSLWNDMEHIMHYATPFLSPKP